MGGWEHLLCRGIRGATTAEGNTEAEIVSATKTLLSRLIESNQIAVEDIASVFFTVTDDLDAAYPARAARDLGWNDAALLCAREIAAPESVSRCIRVLIHVNTERPQREMRHVYLRDATRLRPDRAKPAAGTDEVGCAPLGRVAIVGLGLIGASIGLALLARRHAQGVRGFDTDPRVRARAVQRGAITEAYGSLGEAVREADVVILAAPVMALRDLLPRVGEAAPATALITDVGSTKRLVGAWAEATLSHPERFVGGHPMAGSERSGVDAASVDLFAGRPWLLTPNVGTDGEALRVARALVQAVGAQPMEMDAAQHDAAVSLVSHLPLVTATALTLAVTGQADWHEVSAFAAGGFRDTTRVASGDPRMARDICLTNSEALLTQIDALQATLTELRALVAARDPAIEGLFAQAKAARDDWTRGGNRV